MKSRKELLTILWIFVTLNYLYCDLIGLMDANLLRQYLTGRVDGLTINEPFLLGAGILMEIPIAMVLLANVLPKTANGWANLVAGCIKTAVMIATFFIGSATLYYIFFASIEIATTLFIIMYAWRWLREEVT
ncbi:hypothetical protein F5984_14880 [Rudanella paleaurantiibacter]|uniref:DoxX family protein n=1 Tax=Rudanella paleaurantiibacter TaxID=2614655 RepID=A0A7J5TZ61_9BACT|nr:DUF6326 family protein [Rudanella paleaurantiibacter]KAB7730429.1 hypothetical protein F5984_14880 [Rudanella paleaurantiibacter]